MLTTGLQSLNSDIEATYGSIHNYYEKLVLDAITLHDNTRSLSHELQADIACLALNKLPTKYVRYDVDTVFYLTSEEQETILTDVNTAVNEAISYIELRLKAKEHGLTEEV